MLGVRLSHLPLEPLEQYGLVRLQLLKLTIQLLVLSRVLSRELLGLLFALLLDARDLRSDARSHEANDYAKIST